MAKNKERRKKQKQRISGKVWMPFYEDGPKPWIYGFTKRAVENMVARPFCKNPPKVEVKRVLLRIDIL